MRIIETLKSNDENEIQTEVKEVLPFGMRLSSKNAINYRNVGNFRVHTYPKPKLKPITVPVHRIVHPVQYVDADENELAPIRRAKQARKQTVFELEPSHADRPPIVFHFKTLSSNVHLSHSHIPARMPPLKESKSEERPRLIVKEVNIPVIQEIYEYITPKRYYLREVKPVIEIQNRMIAQSSVPVSITEFSDTHKDKGMECLHFDHFGIYDRNLYNGETPYDYKYNSTRGLMSYINSDNLLFNILRKYKD